MLLASASVSFALSDCVGDNDTSGTWTNCSGTYTFPNGDEYVGQFKNGEFDGLGNLSAPDGRLYKGHWKNGKFDGQGALTFPDDWKYIGEFKNGNINGKGFVTALVNEGDVLKLEGNFPELDPLSDDFDENLIATLANMELNISISIDGKELFKIFGKIVNTNGAEGFFGTGYFIQPDGGKFEGEIRGTAENFSGKGTYTYPDGDKYIGGFKDGQMGGQGTYTHLNGDKYTGEHKDGKRSGQGSFTWTNGDEYLGDWSNDNKNGQGTFTYSDGKKHFGEWKNGRFYNGQGTIKYEDNSIYLGITKDGTRNGQGTLTYPDGKKHFGEWKNDRFDNGQGTIKYENGSVYVGRVKDGNRNGQGILTFLDGEKNFGEWKNNRLYTGHGKYTYPDGSVYVGRVKDGNRNGQGILTYASGATEEGFWLDNLLEYKWIYQPQTCPSDQTKKYFNCFGTYTYPDGDEYIGEWGNNKYQGFGILTYADGKKYFGEFVNDKYSGYGQYTYPDGSKYIGEFKDNKKNGQGKYTNPDGTVQEGIWKNDQFQNPGQVTPSVEIGETPSQSDEILSASSGSGFAVSVDGYVITNHHVIEGCQKVVVHTVEKDITAKIITYDPQNDLALLKGDFRPSTVFALSNSSPELLQDVYVAGYPFGIEISTSVKVTKGIISSLTGIGNNFSNIQIDAALQSGNSGGPIIDEKGNIVGVAVAKLDSKFILENFGSLPENTNFGIKSAAVRNILDSNDVDYPSENQISISKSKLGKMISNGTYYISCWMTTAQIETMRTKKVLFENLN